jgi:hypothetical protein
MLQRVYEICLLVICTGTLELKDNKVIVLVENIFEYREAEAV